MHTLLVTGGAGFIGGCFVRQSIAAGDTRVVNLDKLTYAGNLDSLGDALNNPRHTFVQCDVADRNLVGTLLEKHRPQAVVHFAAESHVDRSIDKPGEFVRTNVLGTFELLEAVRGYWSRLDDTHRDNFRFLHISTDEVFGSLGDRGAFCGRHPTRPTRPTRPRKPPPTTSCGPTFIPIVCPS